MPDPTASPGDDARSDQTRDQKEFLFVDESGDPGSSGSPLYLVGVLHVTEEVLGRLRLHLTAFRYHHELAKEFKDPRWAARFGPGFWKLVEPLASLAPSGKVTITVNWLNKRKYAANGGPYLGVGQAQQFRNYQLRRLLERHRTRRTWGTRTDLVLDRWGMSIAQRRNLEDYLLGNFRLRPPLEAVTLVDSLYVDLVQVVDVCLRLARRVVEGHANSAEEQLASELMDIDEVAGGLYPS